MKLPLVVCEWADAWVKAEEPVTLADVATSHKPILVTTIGYVLLHDGEGISIANEFYDDVYRGRTFVPAAMIRSVTPYKLAKPRKSKPPCEPSSP